MLLRATKPCLTSEALVNASRRVVACLICLLFFGAPSASANPPFTWNDPDVLPEPTSPRHISFVRNFFLGTAIKDWQLKQDIETRIAGNPPEGASYGRVDLMMNGCFAGGFVNDLRPLKQLDKPYSITTGSAWNEVSWSVLTRKDIVPADPALNNFETSWLSVPLVDPNNPNGPLPGMRELAFKAREKDPFGPVFTDWEPSSIEHPQYESADAQPGGVNDLSTLKHHEGGSEQYAILAVFGSTREERFDIDIARMYRKLRVDYGVPASHIAVLYHNGEGNDGMSNILVPDTVIPLPEPLSTVPVRAGNSRQSWEEAIAGLHFGLGATPDSDDKLFVYTTGHGAHGVYRKQGIQELGVNSVRYFVDLAPAPNFVGQAANALSGGPDSYDPSMIGDFDSDGSIHLQLHLKEEVFFGLGNAQLLINGNNVTLNSDNVTLGVEQLSYTAEGDPNSEIYLLPSPGPSLPAPLAPFVYEVSLFPDPSGTPLFVDPIVTIEIKDNPIDFQDIDILLAADFRSGEQEFVVVNLNVPEPCAVLLAILASIPLALGRQFRCSSSHRKKSLRF